MIDITIRSGRYSYNKFSGLLLNYFDNNRDVELFVSALLETGQIVKQKNDIVVPIGSSQEYSRPTYQTLTTYSYAGKGRVGIREGLESVGKKGFPVDAYFSKVFVDGRWVNITEKPKLSIVKGRYPQSIEAWRVEIPSDIREKYNISINTPIRVAISRLSYQYIHSLRLWGYRYRVMLLYGQTKNMANPRDLELDGRSFVNMVKKGLSSQIENDQDKIKSLIMSLLESADNEYYGLYRETENSGNIVESIEVRPLISRTGSIPVINMRDLKRKRNILEWSCLKTRYNIPSKNDFSLNSSINYNISNKRRNTKLGIKWSNKGGF